MRYFYVANSKAAPFFSDTSTGFIEAENEHEAMGRLIEQYSHPAGFYSAGIWESADAYHMNKKALVVSK